MFAATIYNANTADATGSERAVSTKETVIGLCTCEVVGSAGSNPTVKVQGKLYSSTDDTVDSGWVDIVTFSDIAGDSVVGRAIGVFTFLRVVVSGNDGNRNIQVSVGYN